MIVNGMPWRSFTLPARLASNLYASSDETTIDARRHQVHAGFRSRLRSTRRRRDTERWLAARHFARFIHQLRPEERGRTDRLHRAVPKLPQFAGFFGANFRAIAHARHPAVHRDF